MRKLALLALIGVLLAVGILASCGDIPPPRSSNWNRLVWNEDLWGG